MESQAGQAFQAANPQAWDVHDDAAIEQEMREGQRRWHQEWVKEYTNALDKARQYNSSTRRGLAPLPTLFNCPRIGPLPLKPLLHPAPPKFPTTLLRLRNMNESDLNAVLRGYHLDTEGTAEERRERLREYIGAGSNENY
ncbi:hypothetical protein A1Q2_06965 [Trichosporon asahii var. asahii CBS 8904]|uniref:SAP domain-containing protein n=2 Tax=Trichosporon asahii var. asahii TaxID=189963 RepID=K1WAR4_TRIAC|nr:hypothetical protein A1Q1_06300 [Trichosporon asahii var. asahii CBS 2479]EJT52194.1 hypothetical protein A1Q1_06300 [Trichosporon asahii var. asahii CBS 2479]EKC98733.1 hypothetical protein A1Q2_06965 [Trichosporon asahii var. asahii CBS 8904]